MKKINFAVFLFVFTLSQSVYSQLLTGEWRDHLPYSQAMVVANVDNKIYCGSEVSLFAYDKIDHSTQKFSKINGLSDIGISAMNYSAENQTLVIGYTNGNLDLIINNTIYNLSDIKRKSMTGLKTINQIIFIDDYAYLSTAFGIVVLNLTKREIADRYIIGANGSNVDVYAIAYNSDNDSIFAATEHGIFKALRSNPNLVDYNNWLQISDIPNYDQKFNAISYFNGAIYASYAGNTVSENIIYQYNGSVWSQYLQPNDNIYSLKNCYENLLIIASSRVKKIDKQGVVIEYYTDGLQIRDASYDASGIVWIANRNSGLILFDPIWGASYIHVNGPDNNEFLDLSVSGGKVYAASGGRTPAWGNLWRKGIIHKMENDQWSTYTPWAVAALQQMPDIVTITADATNPTHFFAGSWGGGLAEFNNGNFVERYSDNNSSLQALSNAPGVVRIGGVAFDSKGNIWVSNSGVSRPFSVRTPQGEWHSFNYGSDVNADDIGELIVTQNDHKWCFLPRGQGLFAFDENGTYTNDNDDKVKKFGIIDRNGKTISNDIYSMAEDLDGSIWVGTNKGVVVYYNPSSVFSAGTLVASQIIVQGEVNDSVPQYLLSSETVTAIAIDGANRKWIGTEKSGVFLLSDDGTKQLLHFTTDDSPLFSNTITSIAIDQASGEIYIATDVGLISYRSDVTEGKLFFNDVYAYPNPVREDYTGPIIIKGLLKDVNVKITDIAGNLVYETTSLGGQALWDGNNFSGQRVHTGVYLVFLSSEDGVKTFVTKLLVIN